MIKKIRYEELTGSLQDPRTKLKDPSTTKTKTLNYDDVIKGLDFGSQGFAQDQRFVGQTGIGDSKYDQSITPTEVSTLGLDYIRASQQPWGEQAGRAIGGGLYKGALTALEDVGYLLDLENNVKRLAGLEDVDTNFVSSWAKSMKESYDENYPIYKYNPNKVMDFSDPGFYWSALQGVIDSAVGFGAIGVGAGATVGKGLKYLGAFGKLGAPVQNLMATAGTAMTTNYAEGKMMALELFDTAVKDRMGKVEEELFNQAFKETKSRYPNLDPNVVALEAKKLMETDKYQTQLQEAEEQIRSNAGEEADVFQRRNMMFMLTDAIAINGMFRGKGLTRNLMKDKSFKNIAGMIAKQAPTEYFEEVGQNVFQKEGEYQSLKAAGHDVSEISSDPLQRTFDFITDPETQLEGMMGLFGGPVQHVLVQAPTNLSNRKSDQEYREAQKEQTKENEQLLNGLLVNRAQKQKAKQDALLKRDDEAFNIINKEDFSNVAYSNFQRGTTEDLERLIKEVESLSPAEAAEKGYGENYAEEAKQRLAELNDLEKSYLNITGKFSGDTEHILRKYAYDLKVKQRTLSEAINSISDQRRDLLNNVKEEIRSLERDEISEEQFQLEDYNSLIQTLGRTKAQLTAAKNEALAKPNKRLENAAKELQTKIEQLQEANNNKQNFTQEELTNLNNEVVAARDRFNRLSQFAGEKTNNKQTIRKVNNLYNDKIEAIDTEINQLKKERDIVKNNLKESNQKIKAFDKGDYSSWQDLEDINDKYERFKQARKLVDSEYKKMTSDPSKYVEAAEEQIKNAKKDGAQRDIDKAPTPEAKKDIINNVKDDDVKSDLEKENESSIQEQERQNRKDNVKTERPSPAPSQDPFSLQANRVNRAESKNKLNEVIDDIKKDDKLTGTQKNQLTTLAEAKKKIVEEVETDETSEKPTQFIVNDETVEEIKNEVDNTETHVKKENSEISEHDEYGPVYEGSRTRFGFNLVAHLHRLYKRVIEGNKVSKESVDNELNPNAFIEVLNPNKYGRGTEVTIEVDNSADTVIDAETQETWKDYQDSIQKLPAQERAAAIRDRQPMIIRDNDGNEIGYLHAVNWITDENIYGDVDKARANLRKIRDKILEDGSFETKIKSKSLGYLFRNKDGLQKVADVIEDENVIYAIGGRGKLISDTNLENLQISNEAKIRAGFTYMVVQTGANENGKVYTAIPLINSKLNDSENFDKVRTSILNAIRIYYKVNNETEVSSDKDLKKRLTSGEHRVYTDLGNEGIDLGSSNGLTEYINKFMFVYFNQNRDLRNEVKRFENPLEKTLFSIDTDQVQFIRNGRHGFINPKNTDSDRLEQSLNYIGAKILPEMYANISKQGVQNMDESLKIIDVQNGDLTINTLYDSYKEYLRDNTQTDILGKKVDTENGEDVYSYTIHPKIELDFSEIIKPVEPTIPPISDKKIKESKEEMSDEEYFVSNGDIFFSEEDDANKLDARDFMLNPNDVENFEDELPEMDPNTPEEFAEKTRDIILPNLDAEKQGAIVDILFKEALSEVINKGEKVNVTDIYEGIFNQIAESLNIRANNIKGQQNNIKKAKAKGDNNKLNEFRRQLAYEKYLFDLYQNFLLNKEGLIQLAKNKLQTVDLITQTDSNENEYIQDNGQDVNEKIHDLSHYESDKKDKASKEIKRFLADIREYDQKGNVKKNFLNRDSLMGFDEVYNQLLVLTAGATPDYKTILSELRASQEAFPFLKDVIAKLEDNEYQGIEGIRNEFTLMMTNHYSNSKYILYRTSGEAVEFVIDDSNANSIRDAILNNWESLSIKSDLVEVDLENNNKYIISKEKAESLIAQNEQWKKNPPKEATPEVRQWLRDVGIVLNDKTLLYLENNTFRYGPDKLKWEDQFTKGLFEQISKGYLNKEKGQELDQNSIVRQGIIKAVAGLDAQYTTAFHSHSHREGNKTVFSYGTNKYLTDTTRDYKIQNKAKDKDGNEVYTNTLITEKLKIAFNKNSSWLSNMIKKDDSGDLMIADNGEYILDLESSMYQNLDFFSASLEPVKQMGSASRDNRELSKLSDAEVELFKIANLEGLIKDNTGNNNRIINILYPTTSDKSTVMGLTVQAANVNFDFETGEVTQNVKDLIYDQLILPEITRIRRVEKLIEDNKKDDINLGEDYLKGARSFTMLPALNNIDGVFNKDGKLNANIQTDAFRKRIDEEVITKYLNNLVDEKLQSWEDNNIISRDNKENLKANYLSKKFLNKFKVSQEHRIKAAATDMVVQYLVGNANIFMTYIGDPALFYKDNVETTFNNIGKRLAADIAPGEQGDQTMKDTYGQAFVADRRVASLVQKQLESLLGKKAYDQIESTDAQEYTTFLEDLFVKNMHGKIKMDGLYSKVRDVVSDEIKKGNFDYIDVLKSKLTKEEFNYLREFTLQPMKPVYVQNIMDTELGIERRLYIKSSSFALSPFLTRNTELDKLRRNMEQKGVSRLAYSSAVKTGNVSNPINIFERVDSEGNTISNDEYNKLSKADKEKYTQSTTIGENLDFNEFNVLQIPRTGFRIQQEVPYDPLKSSINKVSQASKNLFANMLDIDGFSVDWYKKGKKVKGKELKKEYLNIYKELFDIQQQELLEELDYNAEEDTLNLSKLKDILKQEAIKRGYPLSDLQSFDLDEELKFLAFSPSAKKFEALLNSIVTNRVIKMKFPGKSYILGSEEGFNNENIVTAENVDLNKYNIIPTANWDGKLKPSDGEGSTNQILIPWRFKENIEDYIVDGKLDTNKIPSKILKAFGMRIPNQGPNSQAALEIVGFLPETTGDLIIAPRDFVEQMGSDFDVDKLYAYMYATYVDKNTGKFKIFGADRKKAEELYENKTDSDVDALLRAMLPEENIEEILNWDKEKFVRKLLKADLKNRILDIHLAIHENPNSLVQKQIKEPLGFWKLKDIAAKLEKRLSKPELFTGLSDEYQKRKFLNAVAGKAGTGVFSNDSMFNVLVQGKNISFKDRKIGKKTIAFEVQFGNNVSTGDLSNPFTLRSQNILDKVNYDLTKLSEEELNKLEYKSDIITGFQSAAVDNEKEQILDKINANSETFPVIKVLAALGFDEEIPYFLSQDILMDYTKEVKRLRGLGGFVVNVEERAKENVLKNSKYDVKYNPEIHGRHGNTKLGLSTLKKMINDPNSVDDYKVYQRAILDKYMDLKIKGRVIGKLQGLLNVDSQGLGKSLFDNLIRQEEIETLKIDLNNVDSLFEDTLPAMAINKGLKINNKLWRRFFPFDKSVLTSTFKVLEDIYQKTDSNRMNKTGFREKVWSDVKRFIYSNPNLFTNEEINDANYVLKERKRLLVDTKDNKSLAAIISSVKNNLKNNRFLQTLHTFENKNGGASTITFRASTREWRDETKLYEAITDLLINERNLGENGAALEAYGKENYTSRDLFQDLVWAAYLNGGIQEATQYIKYIPPAYLHTIPFAKKLRDWIDNMNNDNAFINGDLENNREYSIFVKQFVQNNPEQLPKFEENEVEDYEDGIVYKTDVSTEPFPFMSTYIKDAPRGFKHFKAYQHVHNIEVDGKMYPFYVEIPVVGTAGKYKISEYNYLQKGYNQSAFSPVKEINLEGALHMGNIVKKTEKKYKAPQQGAGPTAEKLGLENTYVSKTPAKQVLQESLERIQNNSNDPFNQAVAKALLSNIDKLDLNNLDIMLVTELKNKWGGNSKGRYNKFPSGKRRITINIGHDQNKDISSMEHTLLHELIHGVTSDVIKNPKTPAQKKAVAKLKSLQTEFENYIKTSDEYKDGYTEYKKGKKLRGEEDYVYYATESLAEFASLSFTNAKVQQAQNKIVKKDKTVLERFIEEIINILNSFNLGINKDSLLESSIESVIKLAELQHETKTIESVEDTQSEQGSEQEAMSSKNPWELIDDGGLLPEFIPSSADILKQFNELNDDGTSKKLLITDDNAHKMLKRAQKINQGQSYYKATISKALGEEVSTRSGREYYKITLTPRSELNDMNYMREIVPEDYVEKVMKQCK